MTYEKKEHLFKIEDYSLLGRHLARCAIDLGIKNINQLSEQLEVPTTTLHALLHGERKPSPEMIAHILKTLPIKRRPDRSKLYHRALNEAGWHEAKNLVDGKSK